MEAEIKRLTKTVKIVEVELTIVFKYLIKQVLIFCYAQICLAIWRSISLRPTVTIAKLPQRQVNSSFMPNVNVKSSILKFNVEVQV